MILGVVNRTSKHPPAHLYADGDDIPGSGLCWHARNAEYVQQVVERGEHRICHWCQRAKEKANNELHRISDKS